MTPQGICKGLLFVSLSGMLLASMGCANSSVIANNTSRGGRVYGEAGITGDGNTFTVERGSRIHHFSIIGNKNNVIVEDGAWIQKVEVWGAGNVVSVPDNTTIRMTEVGKGNRIERRPNEWDVPAVDTAALNDAMMSTRETDGGVTVSVTPASHTQTPAPAPTTATPAPATATGANYTAPPAGRTNP